MFILPVCGVLFGDTIGCDGPFDEGDLPAAPVGVPPLLRLDALSASLFSRVPRSVRSPSSSPKSPDSLSRDSIRPSLFSKPSMYFALDTV